MTNFIHPSSEVETLQIGQNTTVWQYCVILSGAIIGSNCNICSHCFIEGDVVIGDCVTIKNGVRIFSGAIIEDHVFVGPNVTFTNDRYPRSRRQSSSEAFFPERIVVKSGASIGAGVVILPGLTIGHGAIVAAGTTVVRDVGAGELLNPGATRGSRL